MAFNNTFRNKYIIKIANFDHLFKLLQKYNTLKCLNFRENLG